ncbi:major facilitator superfamily [Plasmopara halstedii]|uniref:Major facilitator superfamily n=1 Tax=Plasmopara halstedii TaxID=4781 RepID=A0A0P1AEX3_PLAHL|nr:major facilitator superfamily [Plasmopara halstedii]CEG39081.1 major facilitator superfamily [Plasmopara halstedii]|eukprot:XP_024575450.1 major facilitator superfamily [Plasmopara halstedii]
MVLLAPSSGDHYEPIVLTKAERRERYMQKTRTEAGYLFKYLILTQIIVYLEAGSIPCLLDQLSVSLHLDATQQGALGGVVYLALSAASPLCAFFLHRFNPRMVLGLSLLGNSIAVLMLALTPTGYTFSANMLIIARAAVGFTQAFPCIYTPLWVDEYAPREKVAGWMSYLQGSVPMGVMFGYFAGTVSNWVVPETFALIETWRWPFLLQFVALLPMNVAIFFVPQRHLIIRSDLDRNTGESGSSESASASSSESCTDDVPSRLKSMNQIENEEDEVSIDSEVEPLHSRENSRTARNRTTFGLQVGTPISTRSTTYHDEEDALLASASMYGVSSQRSVRQLHQNQHQYHFGHCEDDSGASSLRRSMIRPPSIRGSSLLENEGETGKSSLPSNVSLAINRAEPAHSLPVSKTVSSTYGALDTAITPIRSPRLSLLEASILEEDFIEVYEQGAFSEGVYELLHIPVFCLIVFGLTTVYFVVTGVQYWSTIFMIKSLHASKYLVNGLFVIVSGTGPILGVFYGGWLIDRYGGYIGVEQRAKALGLCMILGLTAFAISAVTTFFNDIYVTAGFLWLLLFFGGAILPACTGIFISVVPAEHRALASSFSVMIFNLFGYALSPYLTGLIMEWVISQQGQTKTYFEFCDEACAYRIGFRFCLCWSVWSVLCIGSAWHLASREANEARQVQQFYAAQRLENED